MGLKIKLNICGEETAEGNDIKQIRGLKGQRLDSTKSCALQIKNTLFSEFEQSTKG